MKAKKKDIIDTVSEIARPVCESHGLVLWDVDFYKEGADYTLCILIDREGGTVAIDDCETVSREIDPILDEKDPIDCPYCLEVSSCGADRKLTKKEHFDISVGKDVRVGFFTKTDGASSVVGMLVSYDGTDICLNVSGEEKVYSVKDVSYVRIEVDFDSIFAENGNFDD